MNAVPVSVVILTVSRGWIAHVRYDDPAFDQDIAANSRFMLDRKIEYMFRPLMREYRGQ